MSEANSTLHADLMEWTNSEIAKIIMGSAIPAEDLAPSRGSSMVSAIVHAELVRRQVAQWQNYIALYGIPIVRLGRRRWFDPGFGNGKNQKPKWGQPGRHRRRKARLAARRANERRAS